VARAGERGAVTISTNMAGRGTDIQLGAGVAELGGLYVIGTNKHESRRIDHQLRGRAGRQGDPGSSRFFISLQDDLLQRFAGDDPLMRNASAEAIQRVVEGQNLTARQFLNKYESVIEGQRQMIQKKRQQILKGERPAKFPRENRIGLEYTDEPDAENESADVSATPMSELERLVRMTTIDDLWADYLAEVADYRAGIHLVSWSRDPLHEYLINVHQMFTRLEANIEEESTRRLAETQTSGILPKQRGATWTYLTTDMPFGPATERILRGLVRMAGGKVL
jgi:preprotein translocase subunit SecA